MTSEISAGPLLIAALKTGLPHYDGVKKLFDSGADCVLLTASMNKSAFRSQDCEILSAAEIAAIVGSHPDRCFIIEVPQKNDSVIDGLAGIEKTGCRLMFASYHGRNTAKLRGLFPDCEISSSMSSVLAFYALFKSGLLLFKKKFRTGFFLVPEFIGPSYIASSGFVKNARSRGLKVFVYGGRGPASMKRLIGAGADGVVADTEEALRELALLLKGGR